MIHFTQRMVIQKEIKAEFLPRNKNLFTPWFYLYLKMTVDLGLNKSSLPPLSPISSLYEGVRLNCIEPDAPL